MVSKLSCGLCFSCGQGGSGGGLVENLRIDGWAMAYASAVAPLSATDPRHLAYVP